MTDDEFKQLCEDHGFGAVARGEFDLIPAAMLKALIDAALANERARIAATEVGFETSSGRARAGAQ